MKLFEVDDIGFKLCTAMIDFRQQACACIRKSIGLFPGLKKCPLDTFLRRQSRRRPLRVLYLNTIPNKKDHPLDGLFYLVDDIGLEPMTFRTSSGCSSQLS